MISPEVYIEDRSMYDKICGVAYLVRDLDDPTNTIDWVWETALSKLQGRRRVEIIQKQLVVRLRLPWREVEYEWLCSQTELDENRQDLEVLDIYLRVMDKNTGRIHLLLEPLEFEMNREQYEVEEARYLVCWKLSNDAIKQLLDIDPKSITKKLSR